MNGCDIIDGNYYIIMCCWLFSKEILRGNYMIYFYKTYKLCKSIGKEIIRLEGVIAGNQRQKEHYSNPSQMMIDCLDKLNKQTQSMIDVLEKSYETITGYKFRSSNSIIIEAQDDINIRYIHTILRLRGITFFMQENINDGKQVKISWKEIADGGQRKV